MADFNEQQVDGSFPREEYLTARLMVDSEIRRVTEAEDAAAGGEPIYVDVFGVSGRYRITWTLRARYDEMAANIRRRLSSEPGVRRVAVTSRLPGVVGGSSMPGIRIEINGEGNPDRGWAVRFTEADLALFDVVGRTVIDGRTLTAADYRDDQRVALVNTSFAQELYGGRSPVGRLVRDFQPEGVPDRPWTEIAGVIPDDVAGPGGVTPHIYFPLTGPGRYPLKLLVQVDGEAPAFAPRLRALMAEAELGMLLDEVIPVAEMRRSEVLSGVFAVAIWLFVALVTMLLSTTGVYALMSFIVAQRTREIGIRTALGADAPLVVRGVFWRAVTQLGLGVLVGLALVGVVLRQSVGHRRRGRPHGRRIDRLRGPTRSRVTSAAYASPGDRLDAVIMVRRQRRIEVRLVGLAGKSLGLHCRSHRRLDTRDTCAERPARADPPSGSVHLPPPSH